MILSDKTLRTALAQKTIDISPFDDCQIQPASIDIRLGDTYSILEDSCDSIIDLGRYN